MLIYTGIPAIIHYHNSGFWNYPNVLQHSNPNIQKVMTECHPIRLPKVAHVVTNSLLQQELKSKVNIQSTVIPCVLPHNKHYAIHDEFNEPFRKKLRIRKSDKLILTFLSKTVKKKELFEWISTTPNHIKFVCIGYNNQKPHPNDHHPIKEIIKTLKLSSRVKISDHLISRDRKKDLHGEQMFSLSDALSQANGCLFLNPSQNSAYPFMEAIAAKSPIFLYNGQKSYTSDLTKIGFKFNQISKKTNFASTLNDVLNLKKTTKHNHTLAKKFYSSDILRACLYRILSAVSL